MEQCMAPLLHLKGKPLVRSMDCESPQDALADVVNAARLHGHAQLLAPAGDDSNSARKRANPAKAIILDLSLSEGELEVELKEVPRLDQTDMYRYRLDIYCKK